MKVTVLPVDVYVPAPGVNVPEMPMVPELASVRFPPLAVRFP